MILESIRTAITDPFAILCLTNSPRNIIREYVVRRVLSGEFAASVARSVPFSTGTVFRWVARYGSGGFANLQDRRKSGRPRQGTEEHSKWICRTVLDKAPEQCQFEFALWTAPRLRPAFYQKFQVRLSEWTVRRMLRAAGLPPQRPQRRAAQSEQGDVARWKSEGFRRLAKRAQELGATIVFADESGLHAHCVYGRTWGKRDKTPVVRVANSRFRLNMFAAISPDGGLHALVHAGRGTAEVFCQFLDPVLREVGGGGGGLLLVVGNCSIHKAQAVRVWLVGHAGECEIYYQPTYAPEMHPVELTWALVKREVSRKVSRTKGEMRAHLEAAFRALKESPERVRAFFREEDCQYILA